jgi:hypothetical protein
MEKVRAQIKCIETDDGFRIEVTGKNLKDENGNCCIPLFCCCQKGSSDCCPPDKSKE